MAMASASPALAVPADFQAEADAYVKAAWPADGPGGAVIVTEHGRVVYAAGQGLADVDAKSAITPETVFRLGSITKQFSAAVLLQLVDEGKVSLDDRISKYLPGYPKPGADATIAQILNHTVGVQTYTEIPGFMTEANTSRAYTTQQMIALFKDLPVQSQPGQAWAYNNSGYVLVGAVIEAVTGKPWHEAVEERIGRPLGLTSLRYGVSEASMPRMAKGYTAGDKGVALAQKIHMSVPHAAGALLGSAEDLAKWSDALHGGKVVGGPNYAKMIAPTKMPDGKTMPYGFGLFQERVRGRDSLGHGGGIFGFSTDSLYFPKDGLFIAVLTNSDQPATDPNVAIRRLAALALGNPYPAMTEIKADLASLAPLIGVYALPDGKSERRFFARDGQLYTLRSGASESKVFAAGGDRFFYGADSLNWFEMKRDSSGKHVMEMHQNGADEAEKSLWKGPIPAETKAVAVARPVLERYIGSYASPIGLAKIAWGAGDALTIQLADQPVLALRPTSATDFGVVGVDARIVFHPAGDAIGKLVLHQGGREMVAERVVANP
jgi:CubicO group peptidase (beta-lactamase class C family)